MSEKYRPQVGDRVRVVLEEEVAYAKVPEYFRFTGDTEVWTTDRAVVSIEKVEPPVEVFGPGTVVRSKAYPDLTYAVTEDGYVRLLDGSVRKDDEPFTSENYERIVL